MYTNHQIHSIDLTLPGSDYGGLSREFVELLSKDLFSEEGTFFTRLDSDSQHEPVIITTL